MTYFVGHTFIQEVGEAALYFLMGTLLTLCVSKYKNYSHNRVK